MPDVNVTVMVDGKPAYSAGAVGTPDGNAFAVAALQHGIDHFQAVKLASIPRTAGLMGLQAQSQATLLPGQNAQQSKDNSL